MSVFGRLSVVKKDGGEGAFFDVTKDVNIGRGVDCEIRIKIPSVSRHQSRIFVDENGRCNIEHLSTTSETFLNSKPLLSSVVLNDKDEISVGGRSFIFQLGKYSRSIVTSKFAYFMHAYS